MADCRECGGDGEVLGPGNTPVTCEHCDGTGVEPTDDPHNSGGGGG